MLRREYGRLIELDLGGTLTVEDEKELETISSQLNALEMQSDVARNWEKRTEALDAHFASLISQLSSLPERS